VNPILKECKSLSNYYNFAFINYACATCEEIFPKTLLPIYERRTWRLIEDSKTIYHTILLIDYDNPLDETFNFIEKIEQGKFLIKNNQLQTIRLLNRMNIETREFK
jgi:hypothetical protein